MTHQLRLVRGTTVTLVGGPCHGEREVDDRLAEMDTITLPVDRPLSMVQAVFGVPPPEPPEVAVYRRVSDGVYRHVEGKR